MHWNTIGLAILIASGCGDSDGGLTIDMIDAHIGESGEVGRMVGMTEAHNALREGLSDPAPDPELPPLTWSDDIADVARRYAAELATRGCPLKHSKNRAYGENLAFFGGFNPEATEVAEAWASEAECYSFGSFMGSDSCSSACDGSGGCGHYTQMIWRDTREIGCGQASCGDREIWVCNYGPPGNFVGQDPY